MQRVQVITPPQVADTATLTSGSAIVSGLTNGLLMNAGSLVMGPGIPYPTTILSVQSASQITLSQNAIANGSGVAIAAQNEPVTLAQAKTQLTLDAATFTVDDAFIAGLISQARAKCETLLNQAFLTQTVTLFLDEFPLGGGYYSRQIRRIGPTSPFWLPSSTFPIQLPMPPVQSITSVQFYDYLNNLNTVSPSIYIFEQGKPARIAPKFGQTWPVAQPRIDGIQITYVVGYGSTVQALAFDVLSVLTQAILYGVGWYYEHRGDAGADMPDDVMRSILAPIDHGAYG